MPEKSPARVRIMDAAEKLTYEQGFHAATVDAILAEADASKGAFFHHFASKDELGKALLERYARADAAMLDEFMAKAEADSDDPAVQVISFVRHFEGAADGMTEEQPGCLFASFLYEQGPGTPVDHDVIAESIVLWRDRIVEKLELAAKSRPSLKGVDLESLADAVYSAFEGGFILSRATGDGSHLRRQLGHLRRYLELLLEVEPV